MRALYVDDNDKGSSSAINIYGLLKERGRKVALTERRRPSMRGGNSILSTEKAEADAKERPAQKIERAHTLRASGKKKAYKEESNSSKQ